MRLSMIAAVALLSAAACAACDDEQDDPELRKQTQALAGQVDDLAMEVRGLNRKLDELSRSMAEVSHAIDDVADKLDKPPTPLVQPTPPRPRRAEPDRNDVYAVPIDGDPFEGPDDALVTIVEGYEYACPFCEKVRPTLAQLRRKYGDQLRIVRKQFVVHPQIATLPSQAACAAHKQKRFAALDELLWSKAFAQRKFDEAFLQTLAAEAGLDVSRYKADLHGSCVTFVQRDIRELTVVGQRATPAFYINGRYMSGAQPAASFAAVIDEEIAKAEARIAQGSKKADYYREWVLDHGKATFVAPTGP